MSIPISISWQYTSEHRYDRDLNERLEKLINELTHAVPCEYDGDAGGTSFEGGEFPSDNTVYFIVPNMDCARDIHKVLDTFIKGYDERYEATLERNDPEEDWG